LYDVQTEGKGGQAQVDAGGREKGQVHVDFRQKIRPIPHWLNVFSCKEVGVFCARISSLKGIKKWKVFVNIN